MERDEETIVRRFITIRELKRSIDDDIFYDNEYIRIDDPSIVKFTDTEILNTDAFMEFLDILKNRTDVSSLIILFCVYRYYLWTEDNRIANEVRSKLLSRGFAKCLRAYLDHYTDIDATNVRNEVLTLLLEKRLFVYYGVRSSYSKKPLSSWPVPLLFLHEDLLPMYDAVALNDFIDYIVPCILEKEDFYTNVVFQDMNFKLLHIVDQYVFFNLTMRWLCAFEDLTINGRVKLIEAFKESMDRQEFLLALPFSLFTPKRIVRMKCNYVYENITNVWMPSILKYSYDFIVKRCNAYNENCYDLSSRLPDLNKYTFGEEISAKCISYITGIIPYNLLFKIDLFGSEISELNLLSQDESSVLKQINLDSSMYIYKRFIDRDDYRENNGCVTTAAAAAVVAFDDIDNFSSILSDLKCVTCIDSVSLAEITFVQCGHTKCCTRCAYSRSKCPVCDAFIIYRVKKDKFKRKFNSIQRSVLLGIADSFDRYFNEIRNVLLPQTHMYKFRNFKVIQH